MKAFVGVAVAFVCLFASARTSHADSWSMAASGCMVRPQDMALAEMDAIGSIVRFRSGQTGDIYLTCPVSAFFNQTGENNPNRLWATLQDGDTGSVCNGYVNLVKEARDFSSWSILASIDPTTYNTGTTSRQYDEVPFTHTWDTTTNIYWVQLRLHRSSTSCNISLYGVGLWQYAP